LDDVKVESRARIVFMSNGRSKRTCDWRVRIPAPQSLSEVTGGSRIERTGTSA
jgi:hypothetical protein